MTIIQATIDDVVEITKVNKVFDIGGVGLGAKFGRENWIREQVKEGRFYVKRQQEETAGAMCLSIAWDIRRCYIDSIAMRPSFQKQGIGRELVEFAKIYAQDNGCVKMWVGTRHKYGALGFYQKCGFTIEDEATRAKDTEHASYRLYIDFPEQKS